MPQRGYITDELTDYAIDWLKAATPQRPFFLYLSHKAVHSEFVPAERHQGRYASKPFTPPATMADTASNYEGKPMWVRNQRNSWHGVDFPYHSALDIAQYYRRYAETLLAVDDSLGRIVALLAERKLLDDTLVVFMGDNGFAFGEHGLIDKRTAYESSMRVPLLMAGAGLPAATTVKEVVANIDIAPTILEAAGLKRAADGWAKLSPACERRAHAVARLAPVRVLLGTKLPADADDARAARRAVQVHPLLRAVGHRRAVRSGRRSARDA